MRGLVEPSVSLWLGLVVDCDAKQVTLEPEICLRLRPRTGWAYGAALEQRRLHPGPGYTRWPPVWVLSPTKWWG